MNVWFRVGITISKSSVLPTNYADLIKEVVLGCVAELETGEDVVPQRTINARIYSTVPGIDYVDILLASNDGDEKPAEYTQRSIAVTARERAVTAETKIEVVIDG